MKRYRLRLHNGRVVGPFSEEQILELKSKEKITGTEAVSEFPSGSWKHWKEFGFQESLSQEKTFVFDLNKLKEKEETKLTDIYTDPSYFPNEEIVKINKDKELENILDNNAFLTNNTNSETFPPDFVPGKEDSNLKIDLPELEIEKPAQDLSSYTTKSKKEIFLELQEKNIATPQPDKTQVRDMGSQEYDRTKVTPESKKYLDQLKKQKEEEEELARQEEKRNRFEGILPHKKIDLKNDATEMYSVQEYKLKRGHEDVLANERELEKKEYQVRREKELSLQKRKKEEEDQFLDNGPKVEEKRKKPLLLIVGALILAYVILFPQEEEKPKEPEKIVILEPQILYPVAYEEEDEAKANFLFEEGNKLLKTNKFKDKIEAANKFRESYENSIKKVESLNKLIRVYGELIGHSPALEKDGNQLFKLIQANHIKLTINADVVAGAGNFYLAANKKDAALHVVERFVKAKAAAPSKELFALYLELLTRDGQDKKGQEVFDILNKFETKNEIIVSSLTRFLIHTGKIDEAKIFLSKGLKDYPGSCLLLIVKGEVDVELQDMKSLSETTKKIKELSADNSRLYYGKYLEFVGMLFAFQGKTKEAAKFFQEAFDLNLVDTLVDRLSNIKNIDESATDEGTKIIKKAKALHYTNEAQKNYDRGEYDVGLLTILKATALKSGYFPAERLLSKIQLKLGLANEALINMSQLAKDHPQDKETLFGYLDLLIETFKFNEAKRIIAQITTMEALRESSEYSSANASLYFQMNDYQQGATWLQKAINLNPLNDKNVFLLAKTLTKMKKFKEAKNYLTKAIELEPNNVEYKIAYAELIYELETADAAIGYLYSLLTEYVGNPKILGEIAIYYHKAGKQQQFQDIKKQIENLTIKDPTVYRFMIKTALLDERYDDAQKYTEELVRIEPGDLVTMMQMGKAFMEQKKFKEAASWFKKVKDRLPSYPKIGYYKSKIELYLGNLEQAKLDVEADMKENGDYEEGLVLKGDILAKEEKYIEAEKIYKEAQKLNLKSVDAILGLAYISFKKQQFEIALDLYKRAEREQPGNPQVHRQLGEVYRFLGQGALAIEAYKMYLDLLPNAPDKDQIESHIRILE